MIRRTTTQRVVHTAGVTLSLILIVPPVFAGAFLRLDAETAPSQPKEILVNDPIAASRTIVAGSGSLYLSPGSNGRAAADLRSGTLRAYSDGSIANMQGSFPSASATLSDTITVVGPGPMVFVTATLSIDGVFDSNGLGGTDLEIQQSVSGSVSIGQQATGAANVSLTGTRVFTRMTGMSDMDSTFSNRADAPGTSFAAAANGVAIVLTATATVPVNTATPISSYLGLQNGCQGTCNGWDGTASFGNTARLAITLPDGYTYTSGSGVLLSNAGGAGLPLPADGDLVGVGGDGGAPIPGDGVDGGVSGGSTDGGTGSHTDGGTSSGTDGGTKSKSSGGCEIGGSSATDISPTALAGIFAGVAALLCRARRRKRA